MTALFALTARPIPIMKRSKIDRMLLSRNLGGIDFWKTSHVLSSFSLSSSAAATPSVSSVLAEGCCISCLVMVAGCRWIGCC